MAKTRLKAVAAAYPVPQSRDEVAEHIRAIGDTERAKLRLVAQMNDQIAEITARYQPEIDLLGGRIEAMTQGVHVWCEAHRAELLKGDAKTANLVTGEVAWRIRPPSVTVRGAEAVIEALKRFGLGRFVRVKEEVNKEAILNERAAVAGVPGISIASGIEDFVITPFEQEAA